MARNRTPDSSKRARPEPALKIDTPVLVVSLLTAFFATLFATLLFLRPESGVPAVPVSVDSQSARMAPPVSARPPDIPSREETNGESKLEPTLRARLEELGVICAEGANCYPE